MSYAPLDVHFDEHIKYARLELEHFGLMACALAYCNRVYSDGFVAEKAVRGFGASGKGLKVAVQLVEQGIWTRVDGGFSIVGYLDHNLSKAQIEERRLAKSEAGARGGKARSKTEASAQASAQAPASSVGALSAQANAKLSQITLSDGIERREEREREAPIPARASKIPSVRLPADWEPSTDIIAYCSQKLRMRDPLACLEDFRDCFQAMADSNKNARKNDWGAAYRLWARRAISEGKVALRPELITPEKPELRAVLSPEEAGEQAEALHDLLENYGPKRVGT